MTARNPVVAALKCDCYFPFLCRRCMKTLKKLKFEAQDFQDEARELLNNPRPKLVPPSGFKERSCWCDFTPGGLRGAVET